MDGLREFLEDPSLQGHAKGNFLGLLHIAIGRRIEKADGTVVSTGVAWRQLAGLLKKARWDRDAVLELGLDPAKLPPRDRERFWYAVICRAGVDSAAASAAGDRLAALLKRAGYIVSPPPGSSPSSPS